MIEGNEKVTIPNGTVATMMRGRSNTKASIMNEHQEPVYLSGLKVDLLPKNPFTRARRAMKKMMVKSKSSIVELCIK